MRNNLAVAILLVSTLCRADDPAALAQSLFEEGRKLSQEQNNWPAACPKFAESHRIKPGGGVVLNLALCYRKTGRTASAYARYKEGLAFAVRDKNEARIKLANDAIVELEPLLSYLTVIVPAPSDDPKLEITLDGQPIPRVAWGSRFPVDPGTRVIVATAPEKKPFRGEVVVGESADQKSLEIPALLPDPKPIVAPPPPRDELVTVDHPKRRLAGAIVTGVGIATLAGGGYLAARAFSIKSESDAECTGGCNKRGSELSADAVRTGTIATGVIAGGVLLTSAGVYLLLTSTTKETRAPSVAFAPGFAFVSFTGAF
jgi:hypothetical protein